MILARISKAVREQNWFAVALEFVIVIAGVVIGFQISAWNETRIEHQREALILERLHADFTEIEQRTESVVDQFGTRIEAGSALVAVLRRNPDEVSNRDVLRALESAIGTPVPNGRSATYAELVASGEMRLIRSEHLRTALVEFDEQVRRQELAYASLARMITDNAGSLLEASAFASSDVDALPLHLQSAFYDLRASPELYAAAALALRTNLTNRVWHEGTLERARDVLAAMPDEAPETTTP